MKLADLIDALELAADETSYHLDRETGKVHMLTDDELRLAEDGEERNDLPDWEREQVELARKINPALLDQLRARLVSEVVPHHAFHLIPRKGLLLRSRGQRQNHGCDENEQE